MNFKIRDENKSAKAKTVQKKSQSHQSQLKVPKTKVMNSESIINMQKSLGNQSVQRMLLQRKESGSFDVDENTANQINSSRGQGHSLDSAVSEKAGSVMGQDFSDVSVHTGNQAQELSNQVSARAFTVGNDIYFNEGEYNPSSSDGERLIAHELTHVVQQGASQQAIQTKMTVNDPNDQYEVEADRVADSVVSAETIQEEELQAKMFQREEIEEEVQAKEIQREEMVEEDELQAKELQREEIAEEEIV